MKSLYRAIRLLTFANSDKDIAKYLTTYRDEIFVGANKKLKKPDFYNYDLIDTEFVNEYIAKRISTATDPVEVELLLRLTSDKNEENLADDGSYEHAQVDDNEGFFLPNNNKLNFASTIEGSAMFRYAYAATFLIQNYLQFKEVRMLDIGCSKATFLHFWRDHFNPGKKPRLNYVGVDIRDEAIEHSKDHFPNHTFFKRDIVSEDIPKPGDNLYDVAFVMEVIEHIPVDAGKVLLQKTYDALKDDGMIVLSSPNPKKHIGQMLTNDSDHVFEYSFEEISTLLAESSFEITDVSGWFGRAAYMTMGLTEEETRLYGKLSRLGAGLRMAVMSFLRPDLSECYTIVAKKIPRGQVIAHDLSSYSSSNQVDYKQKSRNA